MLKWLLNRRIKAFEQAYQYDMSYVRDILAADLTAAKAFNGIMGLAYYRRDLPVDVWYAAKIIAAMKEDCGPCTQLTVKMAEQAGVEPNVLEAVLRGRIDDLPADVGLSCRFAYAVLNHDLEADVLRDEIRRRWGERGLVSLAFGITAARLFPTVKYALGHGKACVRVRVGGKELAVNSAERQAA